MTQSSGPDYRFMPVPTRRDVRRTLQTVRARRYPVLACGAGSDLLDASGRTAGYLVFARFASAAIRTSRKSRTASRAILIKTARSPSASSKHRHGRRHLQFPGGSHASIRCRAGCEALGLAEGLGLCGGPLPVALRIERVPRAAQMTK
jgi:hypothetical protein